MARLPDPVISEIEVIQSRNSNRETFYKMLGQAIRKAERAEKRKGGKGKDETD